MIYPDPTIHCAARLQILPYVAFSQDSKVKGANCELHRFCDLTLIILCKYLPFFIVPPILHLSMNNLSTTSMPDVLQPAIFRFFLGRQEQRPVFLNTPKKHEAKVQQGGFFEVNKQMRDYNGP